MSGRGKKSGKKGKKSGKEKKEEKKTVTEEKKTVTGDTKKEAEVKQNGTGADDIDLDKFLDELTENQSKLDNLEPDVVNRLLQKLNPYSYHEDNNGPISKVALMSETNLRQEYMQRFLTTALVGFLFAVSKEYECPAEQRRWTPKMKADPKKGDKELKQETPGKFNIDNTITKLKRTLAIAEDAKEHYKKLAEEQDRILVEEKLMDGKMSDALKNMKATEKMLLDAVKVREYLTCYETRRIGIEADVDMDTTLDNLQGIGEAEALLRKYPPREIVWYPRNHTLEAPQSVITGAITDFLKTWFEFNPDAHVRKAHDEFRIKKTTDKNNRDTADPERPTVDAVKFKPTFDDRSGDKELYDALTVDARTKNACLHILQNNELSKTVRDILSSDDTKNRFKSYLSHISPASNARSAIDVIPPQDTFHRFNFYLDVNYEELRAATEAIYNVKPDLEYAFYIHKVIEGTEEEIEKQRKTFQREKLDELKSDVLSIPFNAWCMIGPFKKNRERVDFYSKNTEILKRIVERMEADKKIGKELMANRVTQAKAKNIREDGPDAPGLSKYRGEVKGISELGGDKVISPEQMKRLEKANGNIKVAKELEYIEQREARKAEMDEIKKQRNFTKDEEKEYNNVLDEIKKATDMLNVPDNSVRVDVFTHDAKTGDMTKTHFYTKAEAPVDLTDEKQMAALQAAQAKNIPANAPGLGLT